MTTIKTTSKARDAHDESLQIRIDRLPVEMPGLNWTKPFEGQLDSIAQIEFLLQVEVRIGAHIETMKFNRRDLPLLEAIRRAVGKSIEPSQT